MRDNVQRIAREIQRGKTSKEERITANTVMRVAILLLTKHFKVRAVEDRTRRKSFFKKSKLRFLGAPRARTGSRSHVFHCVAKAV